MHTKSFSLKTSEIKKEFLLIDVNQNNQPLVLGRMACEIAKLLKGKHKVEYTPHMPCGDAIVLINANKILVTGQKAQQKLYRKHTGYFGGLKETLYKNMKKKDIITHAVKLMLNKSRQRRHIMKNLYIYEDEQHLHNAQSPRPYIVK